MDRQDAIRSRIEERLAELSLPRTGKMYTDAGVGSTTLRNFLDGITRSMTVETAEKIAPLLKVTAQWLLYGDTAEIVNLWESIPAAHRHTAKQMLAGLAEQGKRQE